MVKAAGFSVIPEGRLVEHEFGLGALLDCLLVFLLDCLLKGLDRYKEVSL